VLPRGHATSLEYLWPTHFNDIQTPVESHSSSWHGRRTLLVGASLVAVGFASRHASASCLPTDALPPPQSSQPPRPVVQGQFRAQAATVFLDVSGSMRGYVAPPRQPVRGRRADTEPRVFREIVLSLPRILGPLAEKASLYQFGEDIRVMPTSALSDATRPDAYAGNPGFYRAKKSRIQDVLARIEQMPPDELGIAITDLFLSGEDILNGAALRSPLARILESGRAIAVIGIRTGFNGPIFDLPGMPSNFSFADAYERPFFIIAAGPLPAVSRLTRQLELEYLAPLAEPVDGRRYHATIFTRHPLEGDSRRLELVPVGGVEKATDIVPWAGDPSLQRFRYVDRAGELMASFSADRSDHAPVLLPNQFEAREHVWSDRRVPAGGKPPPCDGRWLEIRSLPKLHSLVRDRTGANFLKIGGEGFSRVSHLPSFLIHVEVLASGLSADPAATRWTREWSFDASATQRVLNESREKMFPTLNLREISVMLESLVRDELATPTRVAQALVAFQVAKR